MRKRDIGRLQIATIALALAVLYAATRLWGDMPFAYPASAERVEPSLAVRVPLDGPVRVLWGGNRKSENHHVAFPGERWAYDLGIDPSPDEFATPRPELTDFGCWGAAVIAPVTGRVTAARDGQPDNPPGPPPAVRDGAGNYVDIEVVDLQTHLIVMHLARGSVRLRVGQAVFEGDTLGTCGSSGRAGLPHVHIHHQREPWQTGDWLAEGLPLHFGYFRGHDPPRGGGSTDGNSYWHWTGSIIEHVGR
jgi:murein DD-endopeptidase MepM/ murein hydrolase activator NlpD